MNGFKVEYPALNAGAEHVTSCPQGYTGTLTIECGEDITLDDNAPQLSIASCVPSRFHYFYSYINLM